MCQGRKQLGGIIAIGVDQGHNRHSFFKLRLNQRSPTEKQGIAGPIMYHEKSMHAVADAEDLTAFPHQVAGHFKLPLIRFREKFILKPRIDDLRFLRELEFYEETTRDNSSLNTIRMHLPAFYGVMQVNDIPHLMLEDLTATYDIVNILDMKVGGMPYARGAVSEEKWNRQLSKYPHQSAVGFRIAGMKVWSAVHQSYCQFDKSYIARTFTVGDVCKFGIARFFHNGATFDVEALEETTNQIRSLLEWFRAQQAFHFYSSSLLLLHNPIVSVTNRSRNALKYLDPRNRRPDSDSPAVKVTMIDFAHTVKESTARDEAASLPNGVDENYINGLIKLVSTLDTLLISMQTQSEDLISKVKEHVSFCVF